MLNKVIVSAVLASATTLAMAQSTTGTTGSTMRATPATPATPATSSTPATPAIPATPSSGNADKTLQSFGSLDSNADGMLSRDEVRSIQGMNGRFKQLDSDGNGSLSDAEFSKFEVKGSASGNGYGASGSAGSDGLKGSTTTPDSKTSTSGTTKR